jgi:hypothetical protein
VADDPEQDFEKLAVVAETDQPGLGLRCRVWELFGHARV